MRIKNVAVIIVIFAGLYFFGCEKKGTENPIESAASSFPLSDSSRWHYQGIRFLIPFNDTSLADTFSIDLFRNVIGIDTIPDRFIATALVDSICYGLNETNIYTSIKKQWISIDDNKLKEFGIQNVSDSLSPIYHHTPRVLLDFPLDQDKSWIAFTTPLGHVFKNVTGRENKTVYGEEIGCDIVFTPYQLFYSDRTFEWYSDLGLVAREADLGVMQWYDTTYVYLDSVRVIEEIELVDYDL